MKVGTALFSIIVLQTSAHALPGPELEVKQTAAVKLPAVPDFALAPTAADVHDPRELRVAGQPLLGKDIQVTGTVIWIYDCVTDVRKPGETRAETQKRIDDDPTLCERPKLYLGSDKTTPPEKGLWVVDVPRPPNKLELERLPKEKLDAWPAVPTIHLGDRVTITGRFDRASPHQERNSDGLLVFQSVARAKALPKSKPVAMALQAGPPPTPPAAVPEPVVTDRGAHNRAILELNAANKQLGMRLVKESLEHYAAAEKLDPQNHLAWYGDGLAHIEQRDFAAAASALDHCVALAPDQPMYQLWAGIAAYEAMLEAARAAQAKALGRDPKDIDVDVTAVDFEAARKHLELALALEPKLWRAHYYLGKVWRARGAARDAAGEFTKAIQNNANEWGPYVALGELYRKWEYTDAAIAVADAGSRNATDGTSDLFYVLGLAFDDKRAYQKAIDAYTLALAAKSSNEKARFQRGQAYFRLKKYPEAKSDLEAFLGSKAASLSFARQQASAMMQQIDR